MAAWIYGTGRDAIYRVNPETRAVQRRISGRWVGGSRAANPTEQKNIARRVLNDTTTEALIYRQGAPRTMTVVDPLVRLQQATRERALAQQEWVSALTGAVAAGSTLEVVAQAAGVTRARVSQIVGTTGRPRGRRAKV